MNERKKGFDQYFLFTNSRSRSIEIAPAAAESSAAPDPYGSVFPGLLEPDPYYSRNMNRYSEY